MDAACFVPTTIPCTIMECLLLGSSPAFSCLLKLSFCNTTNTMFFHFMLCVLNLLDLSFALALGRNVCSKGQGGFANSYVRPPLDNGECSLSTKNITSYAPSLSASPSSTFFIPTPFVPEPKAIETRFVGLGLEFEYPHLIIPISQTYPDKVAGTVYLPSVNATTASIFTFDIPNSYKHKNCSLQFLLPQLADLQTSSYSLEGDGVIELARLVGNADLGTTWNNAPPIGTDFGARKINPGASVDVALFPCPANTKVSFLVTAKGNTNLVYFQDYNPPA